MRSAALPAILLAVVAAAAFLLHLDRPDLLEKDEPRYAVAARTMARGGSLLVPRYNGHERLEKPPAAYWAMAAAFRATGSFDGRSARLPSAVAGIALVLLTGWGAGRALGRWWGFAAGGILATMLLPLATGRIATTDMLFTLAFTGAAACAIPVLEGSPRAGRWILGGGALAGAAALVKVPTAFLLVPAAAAAAGFHLGKWAGPAALPPAFRPGERGRTAVLLLAALGIGAAVVLAWLLPADAAAGGRVLATLRDQADARLDAGRDVHAAPPWYFLPVLLGGALPWTFHAGIGAAAAAAGSRTADRGGILGTLAAAVAAAVVVFHSALPSKLPAYVLPAAPALAILAVLGLRALAEGSAFRGARWIPGIGLLGCGAVVVAALENRAVALRLGPEALAAAQGALLFPAVLLGMAGLNSLRGNHRSAAIGAGLAPLLVVFALPRLVGPLEEARSGRPFAEAARAAGIRPGDALFDTTNHVTGMTWYLDREGTTGPGGTSPTVAAAAEAFASGKRVFAVLGHDPAEARAAGKRTGWERLRERLPPGTPPPRVLLERWDRVLVTNVP